MGFHCKGESVFVWKAKWETPTLGMAKEATSVESRVCPRVLKHIIATWFYSLGFHFLAPKDRIRVLPSVCDGCFS